MRTLALTLLAAPLLAAAPPAPWFVGPSHWPVERILPNLERHLAEHPDDHEVRFARARVHAWAFQYGLRFVGVSHKLAKEASTSALAQALSPDYQQRDYVLPLEDRYERLLKPEARATHLAAALTDYLALQALLVERPEFLLGFANLLESGAELIPDLELDVPTSLGWTEPSAEDSVAICAHIQALADLERGPEAETALKGPAELPKALRQLWTARSSAEELRRAAARRLLTHALLARARDAYLRAFELARARDHAEEYRLDPDTRLPVFHDRTSFDAARGALRLAQERGLGGLAPETERFLSQELELLAARPSHEDTTPILFALDGCPSLEELTTPHLSVPFDLDGDAVMELWPWITPQAAWLVWDPEETGEITSGRQLFGTASGWFAFPDGYAVLAALDDDGDGALRGAELTGLRAWFDRDTDGVSDRGEVVSVTELGIVALATTATHRLGASLASSAGLELADGRILPTYDWVLAPVEE